MHEAYLIMLRKRAITLLQLGQSRMSPDLITPTILNNTIQRLSSQLRIHYPDLHITNENIRDLYNSADVTGIFCDNRIYVQVPIPVNTYEQIFDVYKLESFLNPIVFIYKYFLYFSSLQDYCYIKVDEL